MADIGFRPDDIELQNLKYDLSIDELNLKLKRITLSEMENRKRMVNLGVERTSTLKRIEEYKKQKEDLKNREVKE